MRCRSPRGGSRDRDLGLGSVVRDAPLRFLLEFLGLSGSSPTPNRVEGKTPKSSYMSVSRRSDGRNPSRGRVNLGQRPTDLSPCLSSGGRLYVAPTDSDRLLCLDPTSGQLLWERKSGKVIYLRPGLKLYRIAEPPTEA